MLAVIGMVATFACFNRIKIPVFTLYLDECWLITSLKRPYLCWDLKVLGSFQHASPVALGPRTTRQTPIRTPRPPPRPRSRQFLEKALWEEVWERCQSRGTSWASQRAGRVAGARPGTQCTDWRLLGASAVRSCPGALPAAPPARLQRALRALSGASKIAPRLLLFPGEPGVCVQRSLVTFPTWLWHPGLERVASCRGRYDCSRT